MATMSDETQLLERLYNEVWNEGRLELVGELVPDEYLLDEPNFEPEVRGPEGLERVIAAFRQAFPDLEMVVDHRVSGHHDIVDGLTIHGTHEGALMGVPATGREVAVRATVFHRFRDHELIEDYATVDFFGLMRQLGVIDTKVQVG